MILTLIVLILSVVAAVCIGLLLFDYMSDRAKLMRLATANIELLFNRLKAAEDKIKDNNGERRSHVIAVQEDLENRFKESLLAFAEKIEEVELDKQRLWERYSFQDSGVKRELETYRTTSEALEAKLLRIYTEKFNTLDSTVKTVQGRINEQIANFKDEVTKFLETPPKEIELKLNNPVQIQFVPREIIKVKRPVRARKK